MLIWSLNSGKTRVFWNKKDISHFFPEKHESNQVEFQWESRTGDRFHIIAHAKPPAYGQQYDFFIGDTSFFSLPHVSALRPINLGVERRRSSSHHSQSSPSRLEHKKEQSLCEQQVVVETAPHSLGFRLSMAGLGTPEKSLVDDLEDELTSDMCTNTLESLRRRVTVLIPDVEDMVSRAIINAFSEDHDSISYDSSSSSGNEPQTPIDIEAEAVCETKSWMNLNVEYAPRPDVEEQKRVFMQKQVDSVFMHVRHERLAEDAATAILSGVATLLGKRLIRPIKQDALILEDLDKNVDVEGLIGILCAYGEVREASVVPGRRFGKRMYGLF